MRLDFSFLGIWWKSHVLRGRLLMSFWLGMCLLMSPAWRGYDLSQEDSRASRANVRQWTSFGEELSEAWISEGDPKSERQNYAQGRKWRRGSEDETYGVGWEKGGSAPGEATSALSSPWTRALVWKEGGTKALTREVTCEASGKRHPRGHVRTWQAALQEGRRHSRLQADGLALHMGKDAGRGWKGDLGVHLEEKQWPLGTHYVAAMETSRTQATWRKSKVPKEGGDGSFVPGPNQMTPGVLPRGLRGPEGPGDGPRRNTQRNLGYFIFLGKWKN